MRILLINKSPVVGKLVTLSAQKSGDELTVADSIENAPAEAFDLLLIDDEFYTPQALAALRATFAKKVLIANRGEIKPAGFMMLLEKPFLPTDLVEMLIALDDSKEDPMPLKATSSSTNDALKMDDFSIDSDSDLGDLDGIGDLNGFDDSDMMGDLDGLESFSDNEDSLGLDDEMSLEGALDDDASLEETPVQRKKVDTIEDELDFGDDLDLGDEEDPLFDTQEASKGGILDEDEISEVKGLLEEDDEHLSTKEDGTVLDATDNEDFADLLEGVESLEDAETVEESFDLADDALDTPAKGLESSMDDMDTFTFDDEDFDINVDAAKEEKSAIDKDDLSMDNEIEDTLGFEDDENHEDEEELHLKIAGGEFASLTEEALSEALGEKIDMGDDLEDVDLDAFEMEDTQESSPPAVAKIAPTTPTIEEKVAPNTASKADAGTEVLKALLSSMESGALKEALKGTKISINITIGGE